MAKKKRRKKEKWQQQFTYEIIGLLLLASVVIGLAELGRVGGWIQYLARFVAGEWYSIFLLGFIIVSFYLIVKRSLPSFWSRRLAGVYIVFLSLLMLTHVKLFKLISKEGMEDGSVINHTVKRLLSGDPSVETGGGMVGALSFAFFYQLFDEGGTVFISFILLIIAILLITGKSPLRFFIHVINKMAGFLLNSVKEMANDFKQWRQSLVEKKVKKKQREKASKEKRRKEPLTEQSDVQEIELDSEPIIEDFAESIEQLSFKEVKQENKSKAVTKDENLEEPLNEPFSINEVENETYELPPLSLLNMPNKTNQNRDRSHISRNVKKLEQTFESFGVKAKVLKVHLGPAVTKYEVHPAVGVKVSKIVNLSDDLALALAAKDIRIEAPIPGKSAVGIEVPNKEVSLVSLREVIESSNYQQHKSKLSIALGRDISGEPLVADLVRMPHLLVAGATGSGKSVCINGIITSLLMKAKPHEVKLMMIDPKMVELNVYNGVPHLLTPVVTDPKKASQALKKVVDEMERRYELFSHTGTRNIEGYNEWIRRHNQEGDSQPFLPYIVVIVDELADLMMVASRDVEEAITRLAQMARAAGIHLIIATQRPSVDVITGVIKANIPSRIAFSVSSQVDSRTILDIGGAEKLLGQGDMLFLPVGASKPVRIQGAFLSDEEVEKIVNFSISQQKANYVEEMISEESEPEHEEVEDELYDDAVQLIIERQSASVSMLQRKFRIGYTRAARLIDEMEARGIVGPYEGSKPRTVLVSKQEEASG
ncbi:cell division protein FtsK [Pueribacillus theae]|uniref:Cell division protein FtsK n=1 Tax=Pueribacillus theae TaxID=2171751 RepID=A0A2U1K809_9BACI|nr:DNA translocase FtsK [Pueribacillus theae]PWA13562.1 cell division protein FtsK [Pueribacillus theae]